MNRIMKSLIQRLVNWAALRGIVANGVYRVTSSEQATASEAMQPFSMRYGYASTDNSTQERLLELMRTWSAAIRHNHFSPIDDQIPNPNDTPRDEVIVRPLP
jgi:hypothetical protein